MGQGPKPDSQVPRARPAPPQPQRDPLTGLFEQDYLEQQLDRLLLQSGTEAVSATLALLQLENFYEIRRWVGKSEANLLLSDIAGLLLQSLPDSVVLCRCRHYEFAALLQNESSVNAVAITERLKAALQTTVSAAIPPQLELKCAVGLARLQPGLPTPAVLFARARHKLSQGLGRQFNGGSAPLTAGVDPGSVLPMIERGLRGDGLRLNFQPLVSLEGDSRPRYEVRCGLTRGEIPPGLLFEVAVQNAMGEALDRWVTREALDLLRRGGGAAPCLTVNLSLNTLVSSGFFDWLDRILTAQPAWGRRLVFQISEIDVLTAQHHMAYLCERLQALDIRLSIKHFGCTPEPFRYLSLLQAQRVQLDVSLHERINSDPGIRGDLAGTVGALNERGLRVIASGVENIAALPFLYRAGVNFVAGNCLQAPTTSMDFRFCTHISLHR